MRTSEPHRGAPDPIRPMLGVTEVAKILGVSRSTVYRLAKVDEIPGAEKMGSSVLVRPAPFEQFMAGELDVEDWKARKRQRATKEESGSR